jgi:hypothetical protein
VRRFVRAGDDMRRIVCGLGPVNSARAESRHSSSTCVLPVQAVSDRPAQVSRL